MMGNPEFRRNLWLELTPHRLIATPVVLVLIVILIVSRADLDWHGTVSLAAAAIFTVMTILWGGRRAYEAIVDEVREHTWDTQRMSALSPWDMTVGKLLGSTIYNWYVGGYCLLAFTVSFDYSSQLALNGWSALQTCLLLILSALFIHGSGLLSGLTSVRSGRTIKPARNIPITLLGILVFIGLGKAVLQQADSPIMWYGAAWPGREFTLCSLAVFSAWVWLGAYRVMADLLAVRAMPWAALSFVIFLTTYLCGFIPDDTWGYASRFAGIGAAIGGTVVYVQAWKERRDWIAVQRTLRAWRVESLQRASEATPDWLVVAVFTLAVSLVTSLLPDNHPAIPAMADRWMNVLTLSPTILTLLMFRDIGLLYFFSLGDRPDRASSTTLIYLVILYLILPGLLNLFGLGFIVLPALFPIEHGASWLGIIIAGGHVAIVGALLRQRLAPS